LSIEVDIRKFGKRLKRVAEDAFESKEIRDALGAFAVEQIVKRVRLGYGVKEQGGSRQKLKPLSDTYREFRKRYSGQLSQFTSVKRSNLTLSGQMLDSLTHSTPRKSIVIYFEGRRRPFPLTRGGKRRTISLTNQELANIHHSGARPFLYFTRSEETRFTQFLRKEFDRVVKRATRNL
jgi:hypothetical protein